jgi:hypothetical protein
MTTTPQELLVSLQTAFPDAIKASPGAIEITEPEASLRYDYESVPALRLGSLALSRLSVSITVLAGTESAVNDLIDRVDRATQRGGG